MDPTTLTRLRDALRDRFGPRFRGLEILADDPYTGERVEATLYLGLHLEGGATYFDMKIADEVAYRLYDQDGGWNLTPAIYPLEDQRPQPAASA